MKHEVCLDTNSAFGDRWPVLACSCGWQVDAPTGPLHELLALRAEHLRNVGAEASRLVRANLTGNTVQDLTVDGFREALKAWGLSDADIERERVGLQQAIDCIARG